MNLFTISYQTDLCSPSAFEIFSQRLTWTLLHFVWQGTTIAVVFAVIHQMLKTKSANSRYLASLAAMTMLVLTPAMTFLQSANAVGNRTNHDDEIVAVKDLPQGNLTPNKVTRELISTELSTADIGNFDQYASDFYFLPEGLKERLKPLSTIVTMIYMSGLIVMSLRLTRGLSATRRLIADSTFVSDPKIYQLMRKICDEWSIRVVPLVAQTANLGSPVVVRIVRPLILLPSSVITGLTTEQIEAVMAHELAHIRRWDMLSCVTQRVVETLLFFHPAVWFVSRRMNLERERACDEMVLSLGWTRVDYCHALLRAAETGAISRQFSASFVGLSASGNDASAFKQRIVGLLADDSPAKTPGFSGVAGVFAVSALLILTSIVFVQSKTPDPQNQGPALTPLLAVPKRTGDESRPQVAEHVATDVSDALSSDPIDEVLIEGNTTIPTSEIMKQITCLAGLPVTQKQIKDDVEALVRTRRFVMVEPTFRRTEEGVDLVFRVLERPIVRRVEYKGLKKIKQKVFDSMTQLAPGSPFDVSSNRESARRIEAHYHDKGFAFATVELEKGNNREDRDVVFRIKEGPKVRVSSIKFDDNKQHYDGVLKTKTRSKTRILSLFGGKYDPASYEADIEGLKQYYHSLGYFDVDITHRLSFSEDKSKVDIHYEVDEGARYQIRNIEIAGQFHLSEKELRQCLNVSSGQFFDIARIRQGTERMEALYEQHGLLLTKVEPIPVRNEEQGVIDLEIRIAEPFDLDPDWQSF